MSLNIILTSLYWKETWARVLLIVIAQVHSSFFVPRLTGQGVGIMLLLPGLKISLGLTERLLRHKFEKGEKKN
jgi:hypothetical protein